MSESKDKKTKDLPPVPKAADKRVIELECKVQMELNTERKVGDNFEIIPFMTRKKDFVLMCLPMGHSLWTWLSTSEPGSVRTVRAWLNWECSIGNVELVHKHNNTLTTRIQIP